ncbi:MAG TPA: hypothetical protein VLG66_05255 [Alphaproteobacteria bacterium]|nr:hypothetical protein [Alphaproteobacteria bacterium]
MARISFAFLAVALVLPVTAPNSTAGEINAAHPVKSPYAHDRARAIKALDQRAIDDLLSGNGAGLALAAELNGYPGPRHVLELADALALDPGQRRATARLRDDMQAKASALGDEIVAAEVALDRAFADRTVDRAVVHARAAGIAALKGRLRAVHLEAHLAQAALLTPSQNARYAELRGYSADGGHRDR